MANPNVDEFARATARARRQMLNPRGVQTQDQVRNEPTTSAERNRERGLPRSGNQPASFEEDA